MLSGHLAVSTLLRHYLGVRTTPLAVGSLFPDLMDKAAYHAGLSHTSRGAGHTLLGLALSTLLVHRLWGRQTAGSWGLGYFSHLLCDIGGFVPWLYPFDGRRLPARRPYPKKSFLASLLYVQPLEAILLIWSSIVVCNARKEENRTNGKI